MSNFLSIRSCFVSVAVCAAVLPVLAQATVPAKTQNAPAAASPAKPSPLSRTVLWSKLDGQFRSLDANKDGFVSQAEVATGMADQQKQAMGRIRQQREATFATMDTNKDGQLSKDEFLAGGPQMKGPAPDGSKMMSLLDTNKDGRLSMEEYSAKVMANFDRLDTNRDGAVSPDEAKVGARKR